MTTSRRDDAELAAWIDDWQADGAPETPETPEAAAARAALIRRVKRRSLGLKLLAAGELSFTAIAVAAFTLFAVRHPHPLDVATMAGFCLLAVGAVAFSFWNRRGLWRPAGETVAAHLALAVARARRRRQGLYAARLLLAAETALFVPWIWHRLHLGSGRPGALLYALGYGYLALVVGIAAALVLWLERWTGRELAELEAAAKGEEPLA